MPGLYVHVPFCERKCVYCDFYSIESTGLEQAFVDACVEEIRMRGAAAADEVRTAGTVRDDGRPRTEFTSVFFGGGTPSLLTAPQLAQLLGALRETFPAAATAEITMECNPGTVSVESLAAFRALGVNRLSFGVQSFHDEELRALSRIHSAADAERAVRDARAAGFDNINVDLMFSLPGQSLDRWLDTLARARELGTTHLSCYSLTIERGTPLAVMHDRGLVTLPGEESDARLYERTMDTLERWGFLQYEISNYALPGYECLHNLTYWRHEDYLGFGPSAHGTWQGRRSWNVRSLGGYLERLRAGITPEVGGETLTPGMLRAEYIFLRLRSEGIPLEDFRARFGTDLLEDNRGTVERAMHDGLLVVRDGRLRLTRAGALLGDALAAQLR